MYCSLDLIYSSPPKHTFYNVADCACLTASDFPLLCGGAKGSAGSCFSHGFITTGHLSISSCGCLTIRRPQVHEIACSKLSVPCCNIFDLSFSVTVPWCHQLFGHCFILTVSCISAFCCPVNWIYKGGH